MKCNIDKEEKNLSISIFSFDLGFAWCSILERLWPHVKWRREK